MININSYLFIYSQSYNLWKKFLHAAIHLYCYIKYDCKMNHIYTFQEEA